MAEQLAGGRYFDDAAQVHDCDAVGDVADHGQVVGDQDQSGAVLPRQRLQQLQDLRLGGDVQRRGRLVGDQQRGIVG